MVGQSYSRALEIFKEDVAAWVILFLVWAIIATIAGSLIPIMGGLLTLPWVVRETSRAVAENRAPTVNGLFDFSNIGDDFVATFLYSAAQVIGMLMCFIGWPFAWIYFWYSIELAADGRVSGTDAMRLSRKWAGSHLGDTIGMAVVTLTLNFLGASLGLGIGLLFTAPLNFLAWVVYWHSVKGDVYALAEAEGMEVRPEPIVVHAVPVSA